MKPKITMELLQRILDPNDFTWVKVKAHQRGPGDGIGPFQDDYWQLLEHHKKETAFLLELIQDLASHTLNLETALDALHFGLREDDHRPTGEPKWTAYLAGINRGEGHSPIEAAANLYMQIKKVNDYYNVYGKASYKSPAPRGEL